MGDPLSERSVSRALLRFAALTTAAVLAFGAATTGALAQEPETPATSAEPTPTSEPSTPPSTPDPTPTTEPSAPSTPSSTPTTEPSTPTTEPTAPSTPDTPKTPDERKVTPQQDEWQGGPNRPDLSVQMDFGRDEYLPDEIIDAKLVVTNSGAAPARDVRLSFENTNAWIVSGAEELGSRPTITPGGKKVIDLKLQPKYASSDNVPFEFRATIDGVADPTPGNNGVAKYAKVRQDKGTLSGVLFKDRNGNGQFDDGEGVANTYVYVRGGLPEYSNSAYTDANGQFGFYDKVPTGNYTVTDLYSGNNTFVVQPGHLGFVVEKGKHTTLNLPAVAAVDMVLDASMKFTKEAFARDEKASLDITLTNRGAQPLSDVVAVCDRNSWSPDYLKGTGPGWSQLLPGGGISLAAGETKTIRVTEDVPQNMRFRTLYADCLFGNNGRNTDGYKAAWAYTRVTGMFGYLTGSLETGDPQRMLPDTPIALLDATTHRVLKSVRTNSNGVFEAYDVPVGQVELVVAGKWKPKSPLIVDVRADQSNYYRAWVDPSTDEVPDLGKQVPDIEVTAKFEKDSFDIAEPIRAKVVVKHVGTGFGTTVYLRSDWVKGALEFDRKQFGDLQGYPLNSGVTMYPGETREITLVGHAPYMLTDDGKVALKIVADSIMDPKQANNVAEAQATITSANGDLAVQLYGDRNANGKRDTGEELADTPVHAYGRVSRDGTTDSSGRAVLKDLPLGVYEVSASYRDGWVSYDRVTPTVSADVESLVEVKAVRPLADKLVASVKFVKREYAAGEDYQLDVTITNNTGVDLPAVQAFCSGPGEPAEIHNADAGWGDLVQYGKGVAVANGETRTFRVSGPQPEDARAVGYATVGCSIGPDPHDPGASQVHDEFRVPGLLGAGSVQLFKADPNGGAPIPVPNQVLVLVDKVSSEVVARSVTDAEGKMQLSGLPVGRYHLVVEGPWLVEFHDMHPYFRVVNGIRVDMQRAWLVPGPEVEDPGYPLPEDQVTPPVVVAGAGGGTADALAKTGASVLGLGLLGALLVAFGLGASIIGRRKQA